MSSGDELDAPSESSTPAIKKNMSSYDYAPIINQNLLSINKGSHKGSCDSSDLFLQTILEAKDLARQGCEFEKNALMQSEEREDV